MSAPANQRKLDVVDDLALLAEQSGRTLIELAVAFVINHPGVTSAVIGPRTMEQLEAFLPTADVVLTPDVLNRIDEIVAPGVTVNPADNSYGDHELRPRTAPPLTPARTDSDRRDEGVGTDEYLDRGRAALPGSDR
jgi:hypothetical protein